MKTEIQMKPKVLALDDDVVWLEQIPLVLEGICDVFSLSTIDQAFEAIKTQSYDVILLDLNFDQDPRSGLDIFQRIHSMGCAADVIVISGETNPEQLVQVFNAGVSRFISKPASMDKIRSEVQKVIAEREVRRVAYSQAGVKGVIYPFVGSSPAIEKLRQDVELVLRSKPSDILIQGNTGTGKEVLARYLAARLDCSGRFLPVHCGAISDGLVESELFGHVKGAFTGADRDRIGVFEAATGGIVFLDEIGEMPLHQQAKLLRVIQERKVQRVGNFKEVNVHFTTIAATHVDLRSAVEQKTFREDLYYRIAQTVLYVPTLAERPEDIPALIDVFLMGKSQKPLAEITDGALRLLSLYAWPGNIRELEAVIRNLTFRAENAIIREKDICSVLPGVADRGRGRLGYAQSLLLNDKRRFQEALTKANGYRDEAAKLLGLSRATFFRRAKELGLVRVRSRSKDAF